MNKIVEARKLKVMLDAGHGGVDEGCAYGHLKEKNLALTVTMKLYEELIYGHDVTLTRATDNAVSFYTRTVLSRIHNPDLFVSIHFNSDEKHRGIGHEILYHQSSEKGEQIAVKLSEYFSQIMGFRNRGARPRNDLYILNSTIMPAIIVECCFIHEEILRKKKTLGNMARILGRGISMIGGGQEIPIFGGKV